jgi:hypothetical protein
MFKLSSSALNTQNLNKQNKKWYVKPTADRGRAEGWMCLASDPPTRPELSRGTCEVWDGDRWTVQNTVTVLTAACAFESMLDVQIFCTNELKSLQERLNGTLRKATSLLTTGVVQERVDEGNKQLEILLGEFNDQLTNLNKQKAEEEARAALKGEGNKGPTMINKRLSDASAAAALSAAAAATQNSAAATALAMDATLALMKDTEALAKLKSESKS